MKLSLRSPWIALWLCLYFLCVFNIGYWQEVWQQKPPSVGNLVFIAVMFFALWAAMFTIMQLFLLPYLHKILLPFVLIAGAAAAYATMNMGAYFNADMIQNVVQTHSGEAKALLSWQYVLWVVLIGVLPALFYVKCVQIRYDTKWYRELLLRLGSVVVGLLVFVGMTYVLYNDFAPFFRNNRDIVHKLNPTNFLGASVKTVADHWKSKAVFMPYGMDAKQVKTQVERKPRVMILVVGETTRAQNWGLNGYTRQTTPELAKREVINFNHVSSCGTATALSVPCIFSGMTREEYSAKVAGNRSNLMDIFKKAGIAGLWRDNDGGCKGVCDRIEHEDIQDHAKKEWCTFEGCLDITLLQDLPQKLAQTKQDTVIVLHTMGSHGPAYYQRYPAEFKRFTPTCDSNQIQNCSHEQLVNTYDNSIIYIDYFLSQAIDILKENNQVDGALWYFSDHGESLGEGGLYLHGVPYAIAPDEQTHIPMVFWASNGFAAQTQLNTGCLKTKASNERFSHDNVFSSMLGIFDVHTSVYQSQLDLFKSCRPS